MLQDACYAVKVVGSVLAGYRGLQHKDCDGDWQDISDGDFPDVPHYVCAAFENGRHIPLPLVLGEDGAGDTGPLQRAVLGFMRRHTRQRGLWRGFYRALFECAWYEHDTQGNTYRPGVREVDKEWPAFLTGKERRLAVYFKRLARYREVSADFVSELHEDGVASIVSVEKARDRLVAAEEAVVEDLLEPLEDLAEAFGFSSDYLRRVLKRRGPDGDRQIRAQWRPAGWWLLPSDLALLVAEDALLEV